MYFLPEFRSHARHQPHQSPDPLAVAGTSLAVDPVVSQAEPPGLWEVGKAVWRALDGDGLDDFARRRVDHHDARAVAVAGPKLGTVGRDGEHVRTAADDPIGSDPTLGEIDDRDRARETVAHVERPGVAAEREAVRAAPRLQKSNFVHRDRIDD